MTAEKCETPTRSFHSEVATFTAGGLTLMTLASLISLFSQEVSPIVPAMDRLYNSDPLIASQLRSFQDASLVFTSAAQFVAGGLITRNFLRRL